MSEPLKERYFIERISRIAAKKLLDQYHYLHEEGNYRSGFNYGLFNKDSRLLIGVCVFHTASVKEIVKGCFGIESNHMEGLFELGRLCINPHYHEKNITSFFLSRSISLFRKQIKVDALLTYADDGFHVGYIYQACNFKYYGLTEAKCDFFIKQPDGSYKKHQRGQMKHLEGEWRPRNQKHRYLIIYDKELKTVWQEQSYPKGEQKAPFNSEKSDKPIQNFIPQEGQPRLF